MTQNSISELKLWPHQEECIERAKDKDYFALLMDPGVGKSATAINILRDKCNYHKKLIPTLILCPPVVISNWEREILSWSKIPKERIIKLKGTGKERAKLIQNSVNGSIFIGNYETLNMPEVFAEYRRILQDAPSCLILDESHKCKDIASKRTKRAVELADIATYRYLLTGTPILNSLMDVYSQFRILDRGERFGSNFYSFRARFFEDKNRSMPSSKYFPNWQPQRDADTRIKELMQPVSMHVEKATCLTLPPFVRKTIEVELGKDQKRLYEEMRRDLVATITTDSGGEKHSIAELAITKALRLQQILSGHVRVEGENGEESRAINIKDNPRKEALSELLESLAPNHKVLVWAVFHQNYEDIRDVCDKLGLRYAELHGLVKDKDAEAKKFREDPDVRVLIGHPGSGGIGVNLVEASYMIYYSRSFSLEYDIQSEARAYRGGSNIHTSVTRIDIVTPGTIDELVLKSLASKTALSASILKQKIAEV
jgi:SNF2 family DNA or RNA helicase